MVATEESRGTVPRLEWTRLVEDGSLCPTYLEPSLEVVSDQPQEYTHPQVHTEVPEVNKTFLFPTPVSVESSPGYPPRDLSLLFQCTRSL